VDIQGERVAHALTPQRKEEETGGKMLGSGVEVEGVKWGGARGSEEAGPGLTSCLIYYRFIG